MSKAVSHSEVNGYTNLEPSTALWVSKNVYRIKDLPEPGQTWSKEDRDYPRPLMNKLLHEGLIERLDGGPSGGLREYRTKPDAYDAVQTFWESYVETDKLLPCNHSGFINRGDTLECKRCGAVHDKEDIDL